MYSRTKMICTIGPATMDDKQMQKLLDAGMNVARINFSHGKKEAHGKIIKKLINLRKKNKKSLSILLDTKGPEIRVGILKKEPLDLKVKKQFELVAQADYKKPDQIPITQPIIFQDIKKGDAVLFDDGYISSKVINVGKKSAVVEIQNSGVLLSSKGINLPGIALGIPFLSKKDKEDISYGLKCGIDSIAASFVCTGDDILELRRFLFDVGYPDVHIIAKIESSVGVKNIDSIISLTDGVMVARGDLGVEVPASIVPRLQKMMIEKCLLAAKPVVVATQMLESMIKAPRPTRAEVSDIATAVYQGASCVMLSGESAIGKYPIESALMMKKVVHETQKDFDNRSYFYANFRKDHGDIAAITATAVVESAYSCHAKAIFSFVASGYTIKLLSRLLPNMPILALTDDEMTYHQMSLVWGVEPFYTKKCRSFDALVDQLTKKALAAKIVHFGDVIVIAGGFPFGTPKSTNMVVIDHIGDVLAKGSVGLGKMVTAKAQILFPGSKKKSAKNKIIILSKFDKSSLPLLKEAKGVILDADPSDIDSQNYLIEEAQKKKISAIIGSVGSFKHIKEGDQITLDPNKALVFRGNGLV